MEADAVQISFDERNFSSRDQSSSVQASEQIVGRNGHPPQLTIEPPTPRTSTEFDALSNVRDSALLSPMDPTRVSVDPSTTLVSKRSHPACLTPGYRAISQGVRRTINQAHHASSIASLGASVETLDVESATSGLAARQPVEHSPPAHIHPTAAMNEQPHRPAVAVVETSTRSRAPPSQQHPHWGPTSEDYPRLPPIQGTGSRYPPEACPHPSPPHARTRTDVAQDASLALLTSEEEEGEEEEEKVAATQGTVSPRGNGSRHRDARHHFDFTVSLAAVEGSGAIPAVSAVDVAESVVLRSRRQAAQRRSGHGDRAQVPPHHHHAEVVSCEDSASISFSETQSFVPVSVADNSLSSHHPLSMHHPGHSLSSSPPRREHCDVVARNPFLSANLFYFEAQNVGRGVVADDDGVLKVVVNGEEEDEETAGSDGEVGTRMREWRAWSDELETGFGQELGFEY